MTKPKQQDSLKVVTILIHQQNRVYDHGLTLRVLVRTSKDMRNKNQFEMVPTMQEKNIANVIHGRRRIMLSHGTSGRKRYEWLESVGVVILTIMGHSSK